MSFSRVVYLYCDGQYETCEYVGEEASSGDSFHETIKSYRTEMKKFGWKFRGRKAYCPSCWHILEGTT